MELKASRENLTKTLTTAGQVLSQKPSLPVLSNFLVEVGGGSLEVSATNLDTTISKKMPVKVIKEGRATIPARLLLSFCQTAGGDQVNLGVSGEKALIQIGKARASLATIPEAEFPPVTKFNVGEKITLDQKNLTETISQVGICASPEEGRPVLTGVLFKQTASGMEAVATDGYRLGKKKIKKPGTFEAVIPARALQETARALSEEEDENVELALNKEKNQARVKTRNLTILSRLLEGEYPNYEQIIPDSFPTQVVVKTKELTEAIKLTAILARDLGNVVKIKIGEGVATVSAYTNQVGEAETTMPAKTSGEKIETAFNSKFLLESLSGLKGEDSEIKFSGPTSAAVIQGSGSKDLLYVVMPVRAQT